MSIRELKPGESAIVNSVKVDNRAVAKALTMGIAEGSTIRCESSLHGAMEVIVHGARFALSKHIAEKFICTKI